MFDFQCVILPPSAGVEAGNVFKIFDGHPVPSSKCLDEKRLKGDALCTAVVEVSAVLGRFPHFNCCGGCQRLDVG